VHSIVGQDPRLVNPTISAGRDGFKPSTSSPALNAGCPLTRAVGSGSGTTIAVENATYFTPGLPEMVEGDMIVIGSNPPVRVVARDIDANTLTLDAPVSWSHGDPVTLPYFGPAPDIGAFELQTGSGSVVGRYIFYNNSCFDGDDPAANAADDNAIAPDKVPLLPGQTATFANYTSYSRGINGIIVDIDGLGGVPVSQDFAVKLGNDDNPGGWADGPLPSSVSVRYGAGAGGSDRVTLIWPDNAIENQWMQLTVKATPRTGLASPDVFYFGNAIGESGNSPSNAEVDGWDILAVRANPCTRVNNPADVTHTCDFSRDGRVGPTDEILVRQNTTNWLTALRLISVP